MSDSQPGPGFDQARLLFVEGLRCFEAGQLEDAERSFVSSLALLPGRTSTRVNLAATRLRLGRPQQALELAEQVLADEPGNVDAWFNRGCALEQMGRHEEALASQRNVLALNDRLAEPWLHQGRCLQSLGRLEQALESYDRALTLDATLASAWSQRGGILRELLRLDEAAQAFRQALAHGGDPELNRYFLASVEAQGSPAATPPAAPARYVASLFDDYADRFDEHLVGQLHYRAHTALVGHLEALALAPFRSTLDLGCGTGLCGPLIRPLTERLTGVDLSGRMLDKARALGVYDQLLQADILDALRGTRRTHDLVLAADVFIYVGDLAPIFGEVHEALVAGGLFCFSAEIAGQAGPGFELLPSLRYAHSEPYLRGAAAQHGFDVLALLRQPIRQEQHRTIEGLCVYLTPH
jgi:predicted TPR repeat methyltransferase